MLNEKHNVTCINNGIYMYIYTYASRLQSALWEVRQHSRQHNQRDGPGMGQLRKN